MDKETRKEIVYRNKQLEALFKNSTDAIAFFDDNHLIVDVNDNFGKLFGFTLDEVKGSTIDDVLERGKPNSADRKYTQTVLSGNAVIAEGTRYTRDGTPVEVTIKGVPIFIDNRYCGGYGIYTDISERKRAEEMLKHSEEKYRVILSTMEEGYYEADLTGKITFCNQSLSDALGYSEAELKTMSYEEIYKDPESVVETYSRVYRTGVAEKAVDWSVITKDGQEKHIEISVALHRDKEGRVIGFRGVGKDITERWLAEEALRESEKKFREILASIEDGLFEVDLRGEITFCNQSAARMLGYSEDEFIGTSYQRFCKNPQAVFKIFNRVFLTGETEHAQTFEMIKKDGSLSYGELSVSLIKDIDENVIGFRGIGRDVTERVNYEAQLKYLSLHDQLTGLNNRSYFENELSRLNNSREYPITIIVADLDGLKLVNDTVGHEQGDQMLKACAGMLRDSVRRADILARVGGDEFVIIMPSTNHDDGQRIIKRIYKNLDRFNEKKLGPLPISLSTGMATASIDEKMLETTFKEADDNMYRDKLNKGILARTKIIDSMVCSLDKKDYLQDGHARRLEKICVAMGEKINLTDNQLADLRILARAHDLGKVGVPDAILQKKGKLTEDEWAMIKQHPEKGYRIALASDDLAGIADLILKHHENWDGSGYPLGLAKDNIPVECRILKIADAYDAMTSNRPYRKAMTKKHARSVLRAEAGKQFDPELVELFLTDQI